MASPSVSDVLSLLSLRVPFDKAAEWDVSGLHLGDRNGAVRRLAVCHELTEAAVEHVENGTIDTVVVYHPLVFRPVTRITVGASPEGRAHRLIRAGVSVIVAHTAFDAAPGGTADALAAALDLAGVRPFGPADAGERIKVVTFLPPGAVDAVIDAMALAGGGTIGNYDSCHFRVEGVGGFDAGAGAAPVVGSAGRNREAEIRIEMIAPAGVRDQVVAAMVSAHPYEEPAYDVYRVRSNEGFIGRIGSRSGNLSDLVGVVADRLGADGLRVSGDPSRTVSRVAVLPGSGGSFAGAASRAGADVFVTGDVGHHTMIEAADRGLTVIDAGHAPTERPGMTALAARVVECVGELVEVVDLTGIDPTPWR